MALQLGPPAASGFIDAEVGPQAALLSSGRAWPGSSLHPLKDRPARGAAVSAPATSAASPLAAVSGVWCLHLERKWMQIKEGGAEHDV